MDQQRWRLWGKVLLLLLVLFVLLSAAMTYFGDASAIAAVLLLGALLYGAIRLSRSIATET